MVGGKECIHVLGNFLIPSAHLLGRIFLCPQNALDLLDCLIFLDRGFFLKGQFFSLQLETYLTHAQSSVFVRYGVAMYGKKTAYKMTKIEIYNSSLICKEDVSSSLFQIEKTIQVQYLKATRLWSLTLSWRFVSIVGRLKADSGPMEKATFR